MRRTVRGPLAARPRSAPLRAAFTIVEMIVVIAVIALVLAIGVPAFNAMTIQQRLSKARQLLNGTLTRTQVISVADRALTAVRLVPAAWHLDKAAATATSARRQVMTTYSYRGTAAANPNRPDLVILDERFERIENGPTQLLPPDTWVAPSEALFDTDSGDAVLDGTIGRFTLDATDTSEDFLSADDFLIVFDPETGVQMQNTNRPWKTWRLLAYDPVDEIETDGDRRGVSGQMRTPFQRYNFTGTVIYQREPFEALGLDADPDARRDVLRRFGQAYYVHRTGGNLVAGAGEGPGGG